MWHFPQRESWRNHIQERLVPLPTELNSRKAGLSFKKKLNCDGVEEWEQYLSPGWCCFAVACLAVPGCWGSARGLERWKSDAEPQPTEAAKSEGRAKWLSFPGDCEHTTSLNISVAVMPWQPDGEENFASDLLYLCYQCAFAQRAEHLILRQVCELTGHVRS